MNRSSQPHLLRVGHRFAAGLLALLWCVAPVLATVHAAEAVHRFCAEHGVVEELSEGEALATSAASDDPAVSGADTDAPAHDHCAFSGFFRHARLHATPSFVADRPIEAKACARPVRGHIPAPVALLRLAPKTSPPA